MIFGEQRVWASWQLRRTLVTFDRDGLWTRLLRRYLPTGFPVERRETLPTPALWSDAVVEAAPWISVVVVDRGWGAKAGTTWAQWRAAAPAMLMLAVVPEEDDRALLWTSAFGFQAVCRRPEQASLLARHAARFWDRIPAPALGDHERIWNNLPWNSPEIA